MPCFEIHQDVRLEWRWRFRANNHEIIASGEGYNRKDDCKHAIALLQAHAPSALVKDVSQGGLLGGAMTRNALAASTGASGTILGNAMTRAAERR